jgi:DNA-binding CsgD family transcriptional regulator
MLNLVGDIYACANDPDLWPDTLRMIAELAEADAAAIVHVAPAAQEVQLAAAWNVTTEVDRALLRPHSINPLLTSGWLAPPCEPYTISGYLGADAYRESRFLAEVMTPLGHGDVTLAVLTKSASRFGLLVLPRHAGRGPIESAQLEPVRLLAPHMDRALAMADRLAAEAAKADTLTAALDLLMLGIILVDEESRIVHANVAGLARMDDARAVRRSGGHLSANDPRASAALKDAVARAARGDSAQMGKTGIAVPVGGADGRDLAAWVLPLDSRLRSELAAPPAAKAAVLLREIGEARPLSSEMLVRRYGITPAEERVLTLLVQGFAPQDIATALGCSEPTVRTHLKRLFVKTGTGGQLDLVHLAASALAPASK